MARNRGGVVALLIGIACTLAGLVLGVTSILPLMTQFDPLTVVESPVTVELEIRTPGPHTLWHDHKTSHEDRAISNPETLPDGFEFALVRKRDGERLALVALKDAKSVRLATRDSIPLGTFDAREAGPYTLAIENPAGDQRVFSLTEGSLFKGVARFGVRIIIGLILGIGGLVLLVLGIVFMVRGPQASRPAAPPTSPAA
jgi:hypothetical protein